MNKVKYVLLILCFLAGIGYFFPAANVNINIPDTYQLSTKFNLGNLFSFINSADNTGLGSSVSGENMRETLDEILELLRELNIESLVGGLTVSMVLYVIVIPILVVLLVLFLIGMLNRATTILTAISVVFYIFISFQLFSLPSKVAKALNENLGFLAGYIDLSKAVKIYPGFGFWLTFIALISMLAISLYTLFKNE